MSEPELWAAAGIAAAVGAAWLLWRGQRGPGTAAGPGRQAERRCSRWLIAAVVLLGAAFAADAFGGPPGGTGIPLTLGDLLALLALPPLALSVSALAGRADDEAAGHGRLSRYVRPARGGRAGMPATARLADGFVLAAGLFVIGWVAVFGPAYALRDAGAAVFAGDLIRPVADLAVLGALMQAAAGTGRRGLAIVLALAAASLGDVLNVPARVALGNPGVPAQAAWLAAICLLGAAALLPAGAGRAAAGRTARGWGAPAAAALGAAGLAAVVMIGWAAAGGHQAPPVVVIAGALAVLALAARILATVRGAGTAAATADEDDRQFRELADRTSDVVLVCDLAAVIRYASPAVAAFGYAASDLDGRELPGLVHPDDQRDVRRAARAVIGTGGVTGRLSCRVRAADGTWRPVESTISARRRPGGAELLITARDVSDEVALRRQVAHLTLHDGLTGLPNRAYLEERARGLLAGSGRRMPAGGAAAAAVAGAIFLDLDGFTAVNDSVGHGAGDLVLAQAARRLRAAVPAHDVVARWGGDEFAVLVEEAGSAQEIADTAERLVGVVAAEPFLAADTDVPLTASVGVALADDGQWEHLLRNADVAMSRAKEAGGARVEMFASRMHTDVARRMGLAAELRAAIAEDQLTVEYQPVLNLATREVTAVEALVRWPRPSGAVEPAEFLGVAEDSGLIGPLGDWVLREAGRHAARWRAAGWTAGLSVNVSPRQARSPKFSQSVLAVLAETGMPPAALTLEVTERVLIEATGPMIAELAELRRHGVRLAIDDFGTGYASLAYLRQLPVDVIKIDPSFVAGLGADPVLVMLTRTIISVGHDLGIEVVAEGIERPDQLEMLTGMGCGLGQGFAVARPVPAAAVDGLARLAADAQRRPAEAGPDGPDAAAPGPAAAGPPRPGDVPPSEATAVI
jgi:diguanylate cyclase (GGDEF)-like protein/PAS domain S-box-containing protein